MRRSWLAVLLLLGACTGPVRSTNVYESQAGQAVPKAELETDRLESWTRDHLISKLPGAGDGLSDLLGAEVLDQAGGSAGRVHDVRLGPVLGGFGAGLRVDGLLVGRRALGARLGYDRGKMKGPLPVKLVTGRLFHDGRYVEWGRVRTIEPNRIVISGTVEDLPRPGPSS
jgi:hypothetical protein